MTERAESNVCRLDDEGIVLRRKGKGQVWSARITLRAGGGDHGRVERSTGERDLHKALRRAIKLAGELEGVTKSGRSLFSKALSEIASEYLASLEQDVGRGEVKAWKLERHRIALENHILPYLGDHKIDGLSESDILDFQRWRRLRHKEETQEVRYQRGDKWLSYRRRAVAPSVETLRKEGHVLGAVMTYAVARGYVAKEHLPEVPGVEGPGGRRAAFTRDQLKLIQEKSIKRMLTQEHSLVRQRWFSLHLRILWIYLTGCRPQEIANLRWADVIMGEEAPGNQLYALKITPEHSRKRKVKSRLVIPLPEFEPVVHQTMGIKGHVAPDEYVIANPDGSQVGKVAKSFKKLLADVVAMTRNDPRYGESRAKELFSDDFLKKTLYSFRHSFITERLEEGMEIGRLARWVGTSVKMIEEYYGKPKVHEEIIQELEHRKRAAEWRKRANGSVQDLLKLLAKFELDRPAPQFNPVYVPLPRELLDKVQAEDPLAGTPYEDEPELSDEDHAAWVESLERQLS